MLLYSCSIYDVCVTYRTLTYGTTLRKRVRLRFTETYVRKSGGESLRWTKHPFICRYEIQASCVVSYRCSVPLCTSTCLLHRERTNGVFFGEASACSADRRLGSHPSSALRISSGVLLPNASRRLMMHTDRGGVQSTRGTAIIGTNKWVTYFELLYDMIRRTALLCGNKKKTLGIRVIK